MKITLLPLARLVLGTVAGIGVVSLLLPQPTWAQTTDVNPLQDLQPQDNRSDPFSRTNEDSGLGMFDLIHRATLGNTRSIEDFSSEQNESLDAAAAQFRARQRQQIQGPGQASQVNPVSAPQVAN